MQEMLLDWLGLDFYFIGFAWNQIELVSIGYEDSLCTCLGSSWIWYVLIEMLLDWFRLDLDWIGFDWKLVELVSIGKKKS